MKKNLILIGEIIKTHGLKGLCMAAFYLDNQDSLDNCQNFYDQNNKIINLTIQSKTYSNKKTDLATDKFYFLIHIENVDSCNDAQKLVGTKLYILKEELPKTNEDEFYLDDLINLKVLMINDVEKEKAPMDIGIISNIHDFGSGPIVEIESKMKKFKSLKMFQFDEQNFPKIDLENKIAYFIFPENISETND